ncbi:MAG TPA: cbb3-type cytochrome c oxidase subunit II [Opitutales bacterium]|nr:cbb3-type cytochrome c oxidase subunit II [Opitutales bacterium]
MKNLSILYCGILFVLVAPWCGLILASNAQYGNLQPGAADEGDPVYPKPTGGLAEQGHQVYIEMGCVYCHTQQPRPESAEILLDQTVKAKDGTSKVEPVFISPDIARGWTKRGAVARDYIYESRPLLGFLRVGPDLGDVGARAIADADSDWLLAHLYDPQVKRPGSVMPPFRFLFTIQKIGDQPSPLALKLPDSEPIRPPAGYEVVPTDRALALVAYLRGLNIDYDLPEVKLGK